MGSNELRKDLEKYLEELGIETVSVDHPEVSHCNFQSNRNITVLVILHPAFQFKGHGIVITLTGQLKH